MALDPKTPGVYVEEITKFPPSIAAVETALPAFIGYTEKAYDLKAYDLINRPKRIGSLTEYELYFGIGYPLKVADVVLDENNVFSSATLEPQYFMYDSVRLFYANGGGDCFIVSVGTYDDNVVRDSDHFTKDGKGIDALVKEADPTILVFPDNSLLSNGNQFYDVFQGALLHCKTLGNRVALLHLKKDDPNGSDFRDKIGMGEFKYGMAYTPWLQVGYQRDITYRDFAKLSRGNFADFNLAGLTSDGPTIDRIHLYEKIMDDVDSINNMIKDGTKVISLREKFKGLEETFLKTSLIGDLQDMVGLLFSVAADVNSIVTTITPEPFSKDIVLKCQNAITSKLAKIFATLINYDEELGSVFGAAYSKQSPTVTSPFDGGWNSIFPSSGSFTSPGVLGTGSDQLKMSIMLGLLRALFIQINEAWTNDVIHGAEDVERTAHNALMQSFAGYKSIVSGIQSTSSFVPPSGAIAGIIADTDRTRGVWKAPANVSISNIIGPKDTFTASELDRLNIDTTAGKSINAIRKFTGKGTLVYGARTLAGNDNEWRYISVRRFFNFVEESTKRATSAFVFEPNDANTWVRVHSMIDNFLTTLWVKGALQGVKPEHAFYVAVGLGKTMTALDILEGRMIVEIGMAVVRPAEFIILRFSHKMPES